MIVTLSLAAGLAAAQPPAATAPVEPAAGAQTVSAGAGLERNLTPAYVEMRAAAMAVEDVPRDDSEDQVRRMAATDRDDSRFFNRPGATRDQYEFEWRQCRQIARRLATSRASTAWMSTAYAHGGLVGGFALSVIGGGLDAGFSERRARRDIRRHCLMARGWRMVEPDEASRRRIAGMPRTEREAWLDQMLGAAELGEGVTVTDWAMVEAGGPPKPDSAPVED